MEGFLVAKREPAVLRLQQDRPFQNSVALNGNHNSSRRCGLPGPRMILAGCGASPSSCRRVSPWVALFLVFLIPLGSVEQAGPVDLMELAGCKREAERHGQNLKPGLWLASLNNKNTFLENSKVNYFQAFNNEISLL